MWWFMTTQVSCECVEWEEVTEGDTHANSESGEDWTAVSGQSPHNPRIVHTFHLTPHNVSDNADLTKQL